MVWGEMSFQLVTFAGGLVSSLNPINQVFLRILALCGRVSLRAIGACGNGVRQEWGTDAHRDNIS
jgi:hypothetical protein